MFETFSMSPCREKTTDSSLFNFFVRTILIATTIPRPNIPVTTFAIRNVHDCKMSSRDANYFFDTENFFDTKNILTLEEQNTIPEI
jgi:hypothetical protein